MTKRDFLNRLEAMMGLEAGTLKGGEYLESLPQWDSLRILEFLVLVDQTFGVVIDGADLMEAKTVDDLLALVVTHIQG